MANVCTTYYVIEGDENEIDSLYKILQSLYNNEFREIQILKRPANWLGYILKVFGGNVDEFTINGDFQDLERKNSTTIHFNTESDWKPASEIWDLVCESYPSLKYFYASEEPAGKHFLTNDKEQRFFDWRYIVNQMDGETFHHSAKEQLFDDVSERLGKIVLTMKEMEKAIEYYNQTNGEGDFITVNKYKVVEVNP